MRSRISNGGLNDASDDLGRRAGVWTRAEGILSCRGQQHKHRRSRRYASARYPRLMAHKASRVVDRDLAPVGMRIERMTDRSGQAVISLEEEGNGVRASLRIVCEAMNMIEVKTTLRSSSRDDRSDSSNTVKSADISRLPMNHSANSAFASGVAAA